MADNNWRNINTQNQVDDFFNRHSDQLQQLQPDGMSQQESGGFFDAIGRGLKGGGAGVLQGQAQLGNLLGIGDGATANYFGEATQNAARKKEYTVGDMLPFASDYWTNPEGATYDIANMAGSAGTLGAETAAIATGAGLIGGALGIGGAAAAGAGASAAARGASMGANAVGRLAGAMSKVASKHGYTKLAKVLDGPMGQLYALNIMKTPLEVSSEAGNAGAEALENGADISEARRQAAIVAATQMPVLALNNTLESAGLGGLVGKKLGKNAMIDVLGSITREGLQNAWEEGFQQSTHEYAQGTQGFTGMFNPFEWSDEAKQQAAAGAVGGFAIGGGNAMGSAMFGKNNQQNADEAQVDATAEAARKLNGEATDVTEAIANEQANGQPQQAVDGAMAEQAREYIDNLYQTTDDQAVKQAIENNSDAYTDDNIALQLAQQLGWQPKQAQEQQASPAPATPQEQAEQAAQMANAGMETVVTGERPQNPIEQNSQNVKNAQQAQSAQTANASQQVPTPNVDNLAVQQQATTTTDVPQGQAQPQVSPAEWANNKRQTLKNNIYESARKKGKTTKLITQSGDFDYEALRGRTAVKGWLANNPDLVETARKALEGDAEAQALLDKRTWTQQMALLDAAGNGIENYAITKEELEKYNKDEAERLNNNIVSNAQKKLQKFIDKNADKLSIPEKQEIEHALKKGNIANVVEVANKHGVKLTDNEKALANGVTPVARKTQTNTAVKADGKLKSVETPLSEDGKVAEKNGKVLLRRKAAEYTKEQKTRLNDVGVYYNAGYSAYAGEATEDAIRVAKEVNDEINNGVIINSQPQGEVKDNVHSSQEQLQNKDADHGTEDKPSGDTARKQTGEVETDDKGAGKNGEVKEEVVEEPKEPKTDVQTSAQPKTNTAAKKATKHYPKAHEFVGRDYVDPTTGHDMFINGISSDADTQMYSVEEDLGDGKTRTRKIPVEDVMPLLTDEVDSELSLTGTTAEGYNGDNKGNTQGGNANADTENGQGKEDLSANAGGLQERQGNVEGNRTVQEGQLSENGELGNVSTSSGLVKGIELANSAREDALPIREGTEEEISSYIDNLNEARKINKYGACVDEKTTEELKDCKRVVIDGIKAGACVEKDGNVVALFKVEDEDGNKHKGVATTLVITTREIGGTKMDCFGRGLVVSYAKGGFKPVARIPFQVFGDTADILKKERPDVYVMMKTADSTEEVVEKAKNGEWQHWTQEELDALPSLDYDNGLAWRDAILDVQESDLLAKTSMNTEGYVDTRAKGLTKEEVDTIKNANDLLAKGKVDGVLSLLKADNDPKAQISREEALRQLDVLEAEFRAQNVKGKRGNLTADKFNKLLKDARKEAATFKSRRERIAEQTEKLVNAKTLDEQLDAVKDALKEQDNIDTKVRNDILKFIEARANAYNPMDSTAFLEENPLVVLDGIQVIGDYFQRAWHTSKVRFEKFDLGQLGTGQGAQEYGWGIYAARNKETAEKYKRFYEKYHPFEITYNGEPIDSYLSGASESETAALKYFINRVKERYDTLNDFGRTTSFKKVATEVLKSISDSKNFRVSDEQKKTAQYIEENIDLSKFNVASEPTIYSLSIPDDDVLLDRNKRFYEQPKIVREAIAKIIENENLNLNWDVKNGDFIEDKKGFELVKELEKALGSQKEASLLFNKYGIDGYKYRDFEDGDCFVIFNEDAVDIINTYNQKVEDDLKGAIQFIGDKSLIGFFESADPSTVIHETGHYFMEALAKVVKAGKATEQQLADWNTMLDYAGITQEQWDSGDQNLKTQAHEKWAKAFETYVMEGKAPNKGLEGAFKRFADWLKDVYQSVATAIADGKLVEITPEVRAVFDNMLGKDEKQRVENVRKAVSGKSKGKNDISHLPVEEQIAKANTTQDGFKTPTNGMSDEAIAEIRKQNDALIQSEFDKVQNRFDEIENRDEFDDDADGSLEKQAYKDVSKELTKVRKLFNDNSRNKVNKFSKDFLKDIDALQDEVDKALEAFNDDIAYDRTGYSARNGRYSAEQTEQAKRSVDEIKSEIRSALPNARIFERGKYIVALLGNGKKIAVGINDQIIVNESEREQAAKDHGIDGDVEIQGYWERVNMKDLDGFINISRNSKVGTTYHEVLHMAMDLALSERERNALMKQAEARAKREGRDVEEALADTYKEWALKRQANRKTSGALGKIWQKIQDFVRQMQLALGAAETANDIFKRIESGEAFDSNNQSETDGDKKYSAKPTRLQKLIGRALSAEKSPYERISLGKVGNDLVALAKRKTGHDLSGYRIDVDSNAIKHSDERHGLYADEALSYKNKTHVVDMTAEDIQEGLEGLQHASDVYMGSNYNTGRGSVPSIRFVVDGEHGQYTCIFAIKKDRRKNNVLSLVTMWESEYKNGTTPVGRHATNNHSSRQNTSVTADRGVPANSIAGYGRYGKKKYSIDGEMSSRTYTNTRHDGEKYNSVEEEVAAVVHQSNRKGLIARGKDFVKDNFKNFYRNWVDKNVGLQKFDDVFVKTGGKLAGAYDSLRARVQFITNNTMGAVDTLVNGDEKGMALIMDKYKLKHNVTFKGIMDDLHNGISGSFDNYLKSKFADDYADSKEDAANHALSSYLVAMQEIEGEDIHKKEYAEKLKKWRESGSKGTRPKYEAYKYSNGLTREKCQAFANNAPREIKQAAEKYYKYNENLLDILKNGNMLTEEAYKKIKDTWKHYCPLIRDFKDTEAVDSLLDQFKGGGNGAVNVSNGLKRRRSEGSMRDVISPLESTINATANIVARVERNKVGVLMVDRAKQTGIKEFAQRVEGDSADAKNCIFTVMRNGKKEAYKTLPEFYPAIAHSYDPAIKIQAAFLTAPAKMLRWGSTSSPSFAVRNFIRDTIFAGISSKNGFIPIVDSIRGAWELHNNPEFKAMFESSGVLSSTFYGDNDSIAQAIDRMNDNETFRPYNPVDIFKAGIHVLEKFNNEIEASTRAGEFLRARKNNKSIEEAMHDAVEVTLNFNRSGLEGQQVNKVVPFFNAAIQGGDKMYRLMKQDPAMTSLKLATYIILPSMMLWGMNHDEDWYKELDPNIKNTCWVFGTKDQQIRIPKPQEAGILFGSGVERMLDAAYEQDPKAMSSWWDAFSDAMIPSFIPTVILPLIEWNSNYSFFRGKPIENQAMQKLPVEMRYGSYTTELSKGIGKVGGLSPVKIDNLIRSVGGTMVMFFWQTPDWFAAEKQNLPAKDATEMQFIRDFFVSDMNKNRTMNDFYELKQASDQYHAGYGKKGKPSKEVKAVNTAYRMIAQLGMEKRDITNNPKLNPMQKRAMIDKIEQKQKRIAQTAVKKYGNKFDV